MSSSSADESSSGVGDTSSEEESLPGTADVSSNEGSASNSSTGDEADSSDDDTENDDTDEDITENAGDSGGSSTGEPDDNDSGASSSDDEEIEASSESSAGQTEEEETEVGDDTEGASNSESFEGSGGSEDENDGTEASGAVSSSQSVANTDDDEDETETEAADETEATSTGGGSEGEGASEDVDDSGGSEESNAENNNSDRSETEEDGTENNDASTEGSDDSETEADGTEVATSSESRGSEDSEAGDETEATGASVTDRDDTEAASGSGSVEDGDVDETEAGEETEVSTSSDAVSSEGSVTETENADDTEISSSGTGASGSEAEVDETEGASSSSNVQGDESEATDSNSNVSTDTPVESSSEKGCSDDDSNGSTDGTGGVASSSSEQEESESAESSEGVGSNNELTEPSDDGPGTDSENSRNSDEQSGTSDSSTVMTEAVKSPLVRKPTIGRMKQKIEKPPDNSDSESSHCAEGPEAESVTSSSISVKTGDDEEPEAESVTSSSISEKTGDDEEPEAESVTSSSISEKTGDDEEPEEENVTSSSISEKTGDDEEPGAESVTSSSISVKTDDNEEPEAEILVSSSISEKPGDEEDQNKPKTDLSEDTRSAANESNGVERSSVPDGLNEPVMGRDMDKNSITQNGSFCASFDMAAGMQEKEISPTNGSEPMLISDDRFPGPVGHKTVVSAMSPRSQGGETKTVHRGPDEQGQNSPEDAASPQLPNKHESVGESMQCQDMLEREEVSSAGELSALTDDSTAKRLAHLDFHRKEEPLVVVDTKHAGSDEQVTDFREGQSLSNHVQRVSQEVSHDSQDEIAEHNIVGETGASKTELTREKPRIFRKKSGLIRFIQRGISSVRPTYRRNKGESESKSLAQGDDNQSSCESENAPPLDLEPIETIEEADEYDDEYGARDEMNVFVPHRLPAIDFENASIRDDPSESCSVAESLEEVNQPQTANISEPILDGDKKTTQQSRSFEEKLTRSRSGDYSSDGTIHSGRGNRLFGLFARAKVERKYSSFDEDSHSEIVCRSDEQCGSSRYLDYMPETSFSPLRQNSSSRTNVSQVTKDVRGSMEVPRGESSPEKPDTFDDFGPTDAFFAGFSTPEASVDSKPLKKKQHRQILDSFDTCKQDKSDKNQGEFLFFDADFSQRLIEPQHEPAGVDAEDNVLIQSERNPLSIEADHGTLGAVSESDSRQGDAMEESSASSARESQDEKNSESFDEEVGSESLKEEIGSVIEESDPEQQGSQSVDDEESDPEQEGSQSVGDDEESDPEQEGSQSVEDEESNPEQKGSQSVDDEESGGEQEDSMSVEDEESDPEQEGSQSVEDATGSSDQISSGDGSQLSSEETDSAREENSAGESRCDSVNSDSDGDAEGSDNVPDDLETSEQSSSNQDGSEELVDFVEIADYISVSASQREEEQKFHDPPQVLEIDTCAESGSNMDDLFVGISVAQALDQDPSEPDIVGQESANGSELNASLESSDNSSTNENLHPSTIPSEGLAEKLDIFERGGGVEIGGYPADSESIVLDFGDNDSKRPTLHKLPQESFATKASNDSSGTATSKGIVRDALSRLGLSRGSFVKADECSSHGNDDLEMPKIESPPASPLRALAERARWRLSSGDTKEPEERGVDETGSTRSPTSPLRTLAERARLRLSASEPISMAPDLTPEKADEECEEETAYDVEELSDTIECVPSNGQSQNPGHSNDESNTSIGFDEDGVSVALFEESIVIPDDYTYSKEELDLVASPEHEVPQVHAESASVNMNHSRSEISQASSQSNKSNREPQRANASNKKAWPFQRRGGRRPKPTPDVIFATDDQPQHQRSIADDDSAYQLESGEFVHREHPPKADKDTKIIPQKERPWSLWTRGLKNGPTREPRMEAMDVDCEEGNGDEQERLPVNSSWGASSILKSEKPVELSPARNKVMLPSDNDPTLSVEQAPVIRNEAPRPEKKRRQRTPRRRIVVDCCTLSIIIAIVLFGIGVGITLALLLRGRDGRSEPLPTPLPAPAQSPSRSPITPTTAPNKPTSSPIPGQDLLTLVCSVSGNCSPFSVSSPQGKAFSWLMDLDQNPNLDDYSENKVILRFALATFYFSTNGENWEEQGKWLSQEDECAWFSSARNPCDASNEFVSLELDTNNLSGRLPPELGLLSGLKSLRLRNPSTTSPSMRGSLPTALGRLTLLTSLEVSGNSFTGFLPTQLSQLTNLKRLDFSSNGLEGDIPYHIETLSELEYLDLHGNSFSGLIPPELLRSARGLLEIYLQDNRITTLPSEIENLGSLQTLDLSRNQISQFPLGVTKLTQSLRDLDMSRNGMGGSLPSELGQMMGLTSLGLSFNRLIGSIPPSLGNLLGLNEELNLGNNQLSGTIPIQLGQLGRLKRLYLNSNRLSGVIPSELVRLNQINAIRFDDNSLTGPVPILMCDLYTFTNPVSYADCGELVGAETCFTYCCSEELGCRCRFETSSSADEFLRCLG